MNNISKRLDIHNNNCEFKTNGYKNFRLLLALVFVFFIFLSFDFVSAQGINKGAFPEGFDIKYPVFESIPRGGDYEFNFHVYNFSNGVPIYSGIDCYFHLYNSTDVHLFTIKVNTTSNIFDYEVMVLGKNFTNLGTYAYLFQCNDSNLGGFVEVPFYVYGDKGLSNINLFIILSLASIAILVLGVTTNNEYLGFLAGALFIITGIYVIIYGLGLNSSLYTQTIGYVFLGVGLIFEVAVGYKIAAAAFKGDEF